MKNKISLPVIFFLTVTGISALVGCKKNLPSAILPPIIPTGSDTDANTTVDADTSFEIGGSNYVFYSMGTYLTDPSTYNWTLPYNIRPVIATYHLAPDTVRKQLAAMYANGQRKISLSLWYADLSTDPILKDSPIDGHLVNSKNGWLLPQQNANLVNVLADIVNQGFDEIMFRFDSQAESDSKEWTFWSELEYQNARSFLFSVKDTVTKRLAGKKIKVLWDLDGELAGAPVGYAAEFAERIWKDWTDRYGSHNTVGFSFAVAPQRLTTAIAIFDKVGRRPDIYSFDMYGNEYEDLSFIKSELAQAGEARKPIFIEEAYYNDRISFQAIMQARQDFALNLKFIVQWPMRRGDVQPQVTVDWPADYSAYLP